MTAVDFFGNSIQLAALAVLCFFPFLIVISTAAGQDTATVVTRWLGLDEPASHAVAGLFTATPATGSSTVISACLLEPAAQRRHFRDGLARVALVDQHEHRGAARGQPLPDERADEVVVPAPVRTESARSPARLLSPRKGRTRRYRDPGREVGEGFAVAQAAPAELAALA
jgi:hypothetical protein